MRRTIWLLLFFIFLLVDLIAVVTNDLSLERMSKPLIIAVLFIYFISRTRKARLPLKKWVPAALFFSWTGDILLLVGNRNENLFLGGLSAFLLAHGCYIFFINGLRVREKIRPNGWLLVIAVFYYSAMIWFLSPLPPAMKIPVRLYGIVISFMFMLAMHMLFLKNKSAGARIMGGALLFLLSDTALAINKFYQPFTGAGIFVMGSYGLAQFLITTGAIRYLRGMGSGDPYQ